MLLECFKEVSRVFQGGVSSSFKGVSRIIERSLKLCQRSLNGVSTKISGHFK